MTVLWTLAHLCGGQLQGGADGGEGARGQRHPAQQIDVALLRTGVARARVVVQAYARMERSFPCSSNNTIQCEHNKTLRFHHQRALQRTAALMSVNRSGRPCSHVHLP